MKDKQHVSSCTCVYCFNLIFGYDATMRESTRRGSPATCMDINLYMLIYGFRAPEDMKLRRTDAVSLSHDSITRAYRWCSEGCKDAASYCSASDVTMVCETSSSMMRLTYTDIRDYHSAAWNALPSPYQNDNCLSFYIKNDSLFADSDLGETYMFIDGEWV